MLVRAHAFSLAELTVCGLNDGYNLSIDKCTYVLRLIQFWNRVKSQMKYHTTDQFICDVEVIASMNGTPFENAHSNTKRMGKEKKKTDNNI